MKETFPVVIALLFVYGMALVITGIVEWRERRK